MNRKPLVSVIIPMYNCEGLISDTLNSVQNQTYSNWECIIVDDGSTDLSGQIVIKYCKIDDRFQYYKKQNAGPSCARNLGLKKSKGEFIQYLDSDDVIPNHRLKLMIEKYENTENNIILYSDLLVGDNSDIYNTSRFSARTSLDRDIDFKLMYRHFGNDILFIPGCILFPRDSLNNVLWDETLTHSEDWDYYLKVTRINHFYFRHIPIDLFYYRNSSNSLSKNLVKIYESNFKILERYRNSGNIIDYCRKSGIFFCRNLINYKKRKIYKIVFPFSLIDRKSIISFLLFPLSLIYSLLYLVSLKES
jgi:glycosyltransferase involved in cell wall biosynthesis